MFTKQSVALLFVPQVIGIVLLIVICVGLVVYVIRESCQQEVEMQDADVAELTVLRMSSLRTRTSWKDLHRPPHLPFAGMDTLYIPWTGSTQSLHDNCQ